MAKAEGIIFKVEQVFAQLGAMAIVAGQVMSHLFPPKIDRRQLFKNLYSIGVRSLPIVVLTSLFVGAIMVIQTTAYVQATGASAFVPAMATLAVFVELGPVLIGLMFSGRVGANTTADLGTMVVTEQMDALRALAIDPIRFFVVPRFLAMVIMLMLLTAIGDLFAVFGGAVFAHWLLDIPFISFIQEVPDSDLLDEFLVGVLKGGVFGAVISIVSCTYGLRVERGAQDVGRAVNVSVVVTALWIYLVDYIITWMWYRMTSV
jgi:phospholipid/cholesterol/gamma-HCH transport system permease protein